MNKTRFTKLYPILITLPVILYIGCKSSSVISTPENKLTTYTTKKAPAHLDSLITEVMAPFPDETQVSIGIVDNTHSEYFGYVKRDSQSIKIQNENTLFEIGSITKVFTGIVLAATIEQGQISLADSLAGLLPYSFKKGGSISVEHLTTHTNGIYSFPLQFALDTLCNRDNPYDHITDERVQHYFENDIVLENEPGSAFAYSNLGTGILGYIVASKNETKLYNCYKNMILDPLQMTQTCMGYDHCSSDLAYGLNPNGERADHWTFYDILEGAGGLLSSATDMTQFIKGVISNKITAIEKSKVPLFQMSEKTHICMNWFYSDLEGYGKWYWHGGGTGGFTSAMFIDDQTDRGIIVLSNVSAYHPKLKNIEKLAMETLKNINN